MYVLFKCLHVCVFFNCVCFFSIVFLCVDRVCVSCGKSVHMVQVCVIQVCMWPKWGYVCGLILCVHGPSLCLYVAQVVMCICVWPRCISG